MHPFCTSEQLLGRTVHSNAMPVSSRWSTCGMLGWTFLGPPKPSSQLGETAIPIELYTQYHTIRSLTLQGSRHKLDPQIQRLNIFLDRWEFAERHWTEVTVFWQAAERYWAWWYSDIPSMNPTCINRLISARLESMEPRFLHPLLPAFGSFAGVGP